MIRNLKAFGLCFVAIFAMGAVAASAAQASGEITAPEYPAIVSGEQINENVLSNGIRSVTCKQASLTGKLTGASKEITIDPSYAECTGNGNTTATVETNGCEYELEVISETAPGEGEGQITINCPAEAAIDINIWATNVSHEEPVLCTLEVPAQGPITGGGYKNVTDVATGKEAIELNIDSADVTVKRIAGTAVNCGALEKTNGTYKGKVLGSATNELLDPIDLMVG